MNTGRYTATLRRIGKIVLGVSAVVALGVAFLLFLKMEQRSLYRMGRPNTPDSRSGLQTAPVRPSPGSDSLRELFNSNITQLDRDQAEVFSKDTLPRMFKLGLIKQLRHSESSTLLIVNGRVWRSRKKEFKREFLTQLRAYNKIHQLPTPTQVRDLETQQLLAEISPAAEVIIFL